MTTQTNTKSADSSELREMARQTARVFAQKRLKPHAAQFDEKEEIPPEFYKEGAELGFFGMMVPEEYGGLGMDYLAYAAAMEELASASASYQVGLTVHNSLVCGAITRFGTSEQKKRYLPRLASGEWMGAYCLSEPNAGSDAGSLKTRAAPDGDSYILDGGKAWVTNAGLASIFIVFAVTDPAQGRRGISCLAVEKGAPGMTLGKKEKKLGLRGSDTRQVFFQNCRVPKGSLLGEEGRGLRIAYSLLDSGRIAIAAQSVGIARAAFEEALSYAKSREQFGSPLIEFQATQFKLADMALSIDAARLLAERAAAMASRGERCTKEASMAKLFASRAANRVAFDALQIHGGNGYIREFAVERYFRDARITEIYEGTSEIQSLIIAREIRGA